MVAVLKSLDVSPRQHRPKRDEFRNPEAGNFGIPKWDFFFMATLMRLLAAISPRHQLEESESVGGSPIMTFPPRLRLRRSKLQFILVDCFVCKLIVEAKGRVLGSNPECSIYRSTTPSTDTYPHPARRYRRSSRVASTATHNSLIAPNIN
ncbi:hypothetical protein [Rhizobium leguminosarum]|uniref:hypothetical protein n=1 Tax=Rhizobium leguminosarum TaxID=384 RepID=UPI001FDFF5BF|nr:hypothetical protein [Rhizobium leguminosarum]